MTLGDKTQINGVWYEVVSYTDGPFRRTMHLVECEGPKEGEDDGGNYEIKLGSGFLAKLVFSEAVPTECGYYLLSYIGARSGKEKFHLVKLGMKPANYNWKSDGPVLAFEQLGRFDSEPWYSPIDFHSDCGVVLWSQRIEKPDRAVSALKAEGEQLK